MDIKLEAYQENGNDDCSFIQSESSDRLLDVYPKWLIMVEEKHAEVVLSQSKAETKRVIISEKIADAALVQAEALKNLAEAATTQANALVRIATLLENIGQREEIL